MDVLGSFDGRWYDGFSSRQQACRMDVFANGDIQVVSDENGLSLHRSSWCDVSLSSRLGNTPRSLKFAEGQKFETLNNDGIDKLIQNLRAHGVSHKSSFFAALIYLLESKFRYVFLALLIVIAAGSWMTVYGVPAASKWLAHKLPDKILTLAAEQTVTFLDKGVFNESALEPEVKKRVLEHFQVVFDQYSDLKIRVLFRDGASVGANAFALPDGTVFFTDQMVRLANSDDELLAVLAHEVGHVYHRHGMRSLVQGSMLAFLLMMMSGDVGATAEIFLALPIFLTEQAYSRGFEGEADDFALVYLQEHNVEKSSFSDLMTRLQLYSICMQGASRYRTDQSVADDQRLLQLEAQCRQRVTAGEVKLPDAGSESWSDYLLSHPATEKRLQNFRSN